MISCNSAPDCSNWPQCAKAQPDPDIAGIGVIVSFVVTAAITLAASIASHLLRPKSDVAHLPSLDPRQYVGAQPRLSAVRDNQSTGESGVTILCARDRQREEQRRMWSDILDRVILSLSDQQLATCFAILLTALISSCQISIYHLNIVCDLAWFATITHLLSIIVLQHYWLQDSKKLALYIRSVLIICALIIILYVVATLLASGGSASCPAVCTFLDPTVRHYFRTSTGFEILVDACIVFWVYPTTGLFVFPRWYKYYHFFMWKLPSRFFIRVRGFSALANNAQSSHMGLDKGTQFITNIYREVFFPSQTVALICHVFLWCLRLYFLVLDRQLGSVSITDPDAEGIWGFGQLLAVIIVFLPFLTLLETWSGRSPLIDKESFLDLLTYYD